MDPGHFPPMPVQDDLSGGGRYEGRVEDRGSLREKGGEGGEVARSHLLRPLHCKKRGTFFRDQGNESQRK